MQPSFVPSAKWMTEISKVVQLSDMQHLRQTLNTKLNIFQHDGNSRHNFKASWVSVWYLAPSGGRLAVQVAGLARANQSYRWKAGDSHYDSSA